MANRDLRINVDLVSDKAEKNLANLENKAGKLKKSFTAANVAAAGLIGSLSNKLASPLGLGTIGFSSMITQAHGLNMEFNNMRASLKSFSDATGDTSKALKTQFELFGETKIGLGNIQGAMEAVNAQGITLANDSFKRLSAVIGNLNYATGISTDSLAEMTAGFMNTWQVTEGGARQALDNMIQLGESFNLTNSQIESVMKTSTTVFNSLGRFMNNSSKSANALTKGIGAATGAMKKFGITTEQSGQFFQKILDPENISENLGLFSRLGISYGETMEMMTSADGQEIFFDKLMKNLPALSKQITALKNPMARLQFSQSLGLPLEIAQKMANATGDEIETLMQEYKLSADQNKAHEKKQKAMASDNARFEEQLWMLKANALTPMMEFVNKHMPKFWEAAGIISKFFKDIVSTNMANLLTSFIDPLVNLLKGKTTFKEFSDTLLTSVGGIISDMASRLGNIIIDLVPKAIIGFINAIPTIIAKLGEGLAKLWSQGGIVGKAIVGMLGVGAAKKIFDFGKGFFGAKNDGSSASKALYVQFATSELGGKKSLRDKVGDLVSKGKALPTVISGAATTVASTAAGIGSKASGFGGKALGLGSKALPMLGQAAKFLGPVGLAIAAAQSASGAIGGLNKVRTTFGAGDNDKINDKQRLSSMVGGLFSFLGPAIEKKLTLAIYKFISSAAEIIAKLKEKIVAVVKMLPELISNVWEFLKSIPAKISEFFQDLLGNLKKAFMSFIELAGKGWEWLKEKFFTALDTMGKLIDSTIGLKWFNTMEGINLILEKYVSIPIQRFIFAIRDGLAKLAIPGFEKNKELKVTDAERKELEDNLASIPKKQEDFEKYQLALKNKDISGIRTLQNASVDERFKRYAEYAINGLIEEANKGKSENDKKTDTQLELLKKTKDNTEATAGWTGKTAALAQDAANKDKSATRVDYLTYWMQNQNYMSIKGSLG